MADAAAPDDERLPSRLAWIIGLRLAFLGVLLTATSFFYLRGALGQYEESRAIVFITIGAGFGLAAVYATVLRTGRRLRRLAEAQIILDQLTWTAVVYVSGGATSGATSFYGLTCLVGATLVGLRGAMLAAVAGIVAFSVLCTSFGFGWIVPPADQANAAYAITWPDMVYPLALNSLGITVVALLSGYLAERLRATGGQLVAANERALVAERFATLGRVATGLAHEIRNPLGSISGSVEMLREAPGLSAEDKQLCDIIQREAARLNNLVSDMMDLAKPRVPAPEPVDLASLARDVVALANRSERSGAGDVTVRYVGPEGKVFALCDPAQMRQVVWNLVRNAVQASGAGTTVTVSVDTADKRALLAVTDEGPGIAADVAARLFDAFFTTRSHGAGIGLAVVRRIIDDHAPYGATIDVSSASSSEGGPTGAVFEVGLARAEPPAREGSEAGAFTPTGENGRSQSA